MRLLALIIICSLYLGGKCTQAQDTLGAIKGLYYRGAKQVQLRWAPTEPLVWQLGNRKGYQITRYTVKPNQDTLLDDKIVLTKAPIYPLSEEQMINLEESSDWVGVVKEALYHESFGQKSDLGQARQIFQKYEETQNRFSFLLLASDLSLEAAEAAGLYWIDTLSIMPDESYVYQISIAGISPDIQIGPAVMYVDSVVSTIPAAPQSLRAKLENNVVHLSWPTLLHSGIYSQYQIERSTDSLNFSLVQKLPYAFSQRDKTNDKMYFIDTLPSFEPNYYYRLRGITPFQIKSAPSTAIKVKAIPEFQGVAFIDSLFLNEQAQVEIEWSFPEEYHHYIKGFQIQKTSHPELPGKIIPKEILGVEKRKYWDSAPQTSNYYALLLIGMDSQVVASSPYYFLPIQDTVSPKPPVEVVASISSSGIVKIKWANNPESDLKGYRVFAANHPKAEFVEITKDVLSLPQYLDSIPLNNLSPHIYYKIVAMDQHYNVSGFSELLQVQKPDMVPPVAPHFISTLSDSTSIQLKWQNSPSPDVNQLSLFKRNSLDSNWVELQIWKAPFPESTSDIIDVSAPLSFQYHLKLSDSSGNSTQELSRWIYFEVQRKFEAKPFAIKAYTEAKSIHLSWAGPKDPMVKKCTIYRKIGENPYLTYQVLSGNPQEFEDEYPPIPGSELHYQVLLEVKGQNRAIRSEEVAVQY